MADPKWRLTERLATILEQAITPSADVSHNVRLPVLGRPDREPRQCDIVISYGNEPRQTITIVEVQHRTSRPDITTFHGWLTKMREVGAQHLICVSASGYPASIINDARNIGPTVRLMTLQEIESGVVPPLILPAIMIHRRPSFHYESLGPLRLETGLFLSGSINYEEPIFSLDDEPDRQSLNDLIVQVVASDLAPHFMELGEAEPREYPVTLSVGADRRVVWFHSNNRRRRILRFDVRVIVTLQVTEVPLSLLSYKQENYQGELAWVATATGEVGGEHTETHLVFLPDEEGYLRIASVQMEGATSLTLITFNNKNDFEAAIESYRK